MKTNSLAFRLVLSAGAWIAAALLVGGLLLSAVFRDYVQRSFDARLAALLESLAAIAEVDDTGALRLARALGDPRFEQVFSGWYWEIAADGESLLRSRSLADESLPVGQAPAAAAALQGDATGPLDEPLRLIERELALPGFDSRLRFGVAGDRTEIDEQIRSFNATLSWSLTVLGLGLLAALFIQVRFGLQPLRRMRQALVAIRTGKASRLEGVFPEEIKPLSDELNVLIEHNAAVVERARTQVSNLAHALKTPLSVLTNEADAATGPFADIVRRQAWAMRLQVDHYLARARTAAAARVIGVRTEMAPVIEDLRRTLERIHRERGVRIEATVAGGLGFRGERQDLEEMLGNLLDNACKWARAGVAVGAHREGDQVVAVVDDDGAGLTAEERAAVFTRGTRLDEAVPGSGLGLSIVRDIADLYSGSVTLAESPTGGLRAILRLPAADPA